MGNVNTNIFTTTPPAINTERKRNPIYTGKTGAFDFALQAAAYNDPERLQDNLQETLPDLLNWRDLRYKTQGEELFVVGQFESDDKTDNSQYVITRRNADGGEISTKFGAETILLLRAYRKVLDRKVGHTDKYGNAYMTYRECAEDRGYPYKTKDDIKNFKKKINRELDTALSAYVELKDNKTDTHMKYQIFAGSGKQYGQIKLCMLPELQDIICGKYAKIKYYNSNADQVRNEMAVLLNDYLETMYSMDSNIMNGRENIISVQSILDHFQSYLPTEAKAGKKLMQLRGKPIITAWEILKEYKVVLNWHFCGKNKEPYTEEQEAKCFKEYNCFKNAYICFELAIGKDPAYQNHKALLLAKKKRKDDKKAQGK